MSFSSLLVDSMDVYRPEVPATVTPPAVAEDFAHLKNDFVGDGVEDGEGETPAVEGQRCRLFEKAEASIDGGEKVHTINSKVYCEVCDVQENDKLILTQVGETARTFVVNFRKSVQGMSETHHYVLMVTEVR